MEVQNLVSLSEISKEMGINKSKLNYYVWLELLTPVKTVSKTMIFDRDKAKTEIEYIQRKKLEGFSLKEIAAAKRVK